VADVTPGVFKPFAQSLYLDLADDPEHPPQPVHLGFRAGRNFVINLFDALRRIGVNHVGLNLKYGARNAGEVMEEIGFEILPQLERGSAARAA
jgi:hypothetical protein